MREERVGKRSRKNCENSYQQARIMFKTSFSSLKLIMLFILPLSSSAEGEVGMALGIYIFMRPVTHFSSEQTSLPRPKRTKINIRRLLRFAPHSRQPTRCRKNIYPTNEKKDSNENKWRKYANFYHGKKHTGEWFCCYFFAAPHFHPRLTVCLEENPSLCRKKSERH